ncbi:MAG TPA: molybdate ABC transporter substrate-binding protein [bacterium]|nr:molybdate ABC transporter substrate-binding protein [bacterium]HOL47083.1 molybdate ABC transporter substrate-binding protein [bacterium]HPQ18983.1 molybdate ABC transporter substrate-binding protein [bacterium]
MKVIFLFFFFLFALCLFADNEKSIDFFCGSAVKVPMDEIILNFQRETNNKVNVIYHGSGVLLSQIELSKKGDLYLAGSPDFIQKGFDKKLLIKGTDRILTYLVPALLTPKGNPAKIKSLNDLTKKGVRISIANPVSVCVGLYAVEVLDYNNLLETVIPNITVFAKSCEDAANQIPLKTVDVIIGWRVFKYWYPDEAELILIPSEQIPRLSYIAIAIPIFIKDKETTNKFINYLYEEKSQEILRKYGYLVKEEEARKFAPKAKIGGDYTIPEKYFKIIAK